MRKFTILAIISLLAFNTSHTQAQNSDHRWAIGVYMNWVDFNINRDQLKIPVVKDWSGKDQMIPSKFSLVRFISPSFNIAGAFSANKLDKQRQNNYFLVWKKINSDKFWDADASIEYKFANGYLLKASSWFAPYAYAGLGLTNVDNASYLKQLIGLGANFWVLPYLGINIHESLDMLNNRDNYLHFGAGVKFRFGGPKDTDKDGIADKDDRCPTEFGLKELQGCPDSDGDGVADIDDKCPGTPAGVKVDSTGCPPDTDQDGVADYLDKCADTPAGVKADENGCPVDSDHDGVADYLDKCPDTPSGVKTDANGCPVDSDHDGVADYLDKCPDTPANAKVDTSGCPEEKAEAVKSPEIARVVYFSFGIATFKADYAEDLNEVARYLHENTAVKLNIDGHADEIGSIDFNMKLSDRRAANVIKYLMGKGIPADRLIKTAYGKSRPVADNKTVEGRAMNRRVEIKTVR